MTNVPASIPSLTSFFSASTISRSVALSTAMAISAREGRKDVVSIEVQRPAPHRVLEDVLEPRADARRDPPDPEQQDRLSQELVARDPEAGAREVRHRVEHLRR